MRPPLNERQLHVSTYQRIRSINCRDSMSFECRFHLSFRSNDNDYVDGDEFCVGSDGPQTKHPVDACGCAPPQSDVATRSCTANARSQESKDALLSTRKAKLKCHQRCPQRGAEGILCREIKEIEVSEGIRAVAFLPTATPTSPPPLDETQRDFPFKPQFKYRKLLSLPCDSPTLCL